MENFVSIIVSITHHGGIYESLIAGGKYKLELVKNRRVLTAHHFSMSHLKSLSKIALGWTEYIYMIH